MLATVSRMIDLRRSLCWYLDPDLAVAPTALWQITKFDRSFRSIYTTIRVSLKAAVSVGRYPEDSYQGGIQVFEHFGGCRAALRRSVYLEYARVISSYLNLVGVLQGLQLLCHCRSAPPPSQDVPRLWHIEASLNNAESRCQAHMHPPLHLYTLYNAVKTYADGYVNIVATYAQSNGSLRSNSLGQMEHRFQLMI